MDIFRACIFEAQLTMEDMKDEINIIVSSFKCRHQKVNYILKLLCVNYILLA